MQVINGKSNGFIGKDKIYIGRGTKTLDRSVLANQYAISSDGGNRDQVIELYRQWLWYQVNIGEGNPNGAFKELLRIARLVKAGNPIILTCWCKPLACHGDVIVRCVEWMIAKNLV